MSASDRIQVAAPRSEVRVAVTYRTPKGAGTGEIWDISASGARVEMASKRVSRGLKVQMHFAPGEGRSSVIKWAEVIRRTQTGFAVRFAEGWSSLDGLLGTPCKR